ncbi:MAG: hypothetical protein LBP27_04830 [Treponema sp.]|jgi:hypothetical protein|nr:hypothetical protein [Treponema sp.]
MSFTRLLPILCLASLLSGVLSVLSGLFFVPPARGNHYAVLAVDEAVSDAEIRGVLEEGLGVEIVSESSQWVLLDGFGGLERIPLDEYKNRLDPRDPRNDGYAEKLRSFFVREGKRLFFIPLSGSGSAEKRISVLLGDLPFSLEYPGAGAPLLFYFLLFCCAAFGALYFAGPALPILPCIPSCLGLAFLGFPGIVLGALLAGLSVLLRKPFTELCALFRAGGLPDPPESRRRITRNVFEPWRYHWRLAPVFAAAYGLLAFFSASGGRAGHRGLFLLFAAGVFFAWLGLLFFSLTVFSRRGDARGHVRFSPVTIMNEGLRVSAFSRVTLPYGLAALLVLLLNPFLPAVPPESLFAGDGALLINEADYLSHVEFQRDFSFRSLESAGGTGQDGNGQSYPGFVMGGDGLVHVAGPSRPNFGPPPPEPEIPPFPLKKLTDFLRDGVSPSGSAAGRPAGAGNLPAALVVVLFVIVPAFGGKFGKQRNSGSACFRWGDKKRKKILL